MLSRKTAASAEKKVSDSKRVQSWTEALEHMRQALRILDDSGAPGHVGAQLDLAMHRLNEAIEVPDLREGS